MIHVSSEFKSMMEIRTDFRQNAEIMLSDGTELTLDASAFTVIGNKITDGSTVTTLPLGVAVSRSITLQLINDDDRYKDVDFFGATIRLFLTFALSETVERVELGRFTVNTPETYGTTLTISAVDDMYKADRVFETELIFPVAAKELLRDVCERCGIALGSTSFFNDGYLVPEITEDLTFRQVIGYIAMVAAGNARIDRSGYLQIISYDFAPQVTLKNWSSLRLDETDIRITGVQTTREAKEEAESKTETVLIGEEGYVLTVSNPMAAGKEEAFLSALAEKLNGKSFRRFDGNHIANPLIEFMDPVYVKDRKGNLYTSVITDVGFTFFGMTTVRNNAESGIRAGSQYVSPTSKAIQIARKLVAQETTAREIAIQKLNEALQSSSGTYITTVEQPDGSFITYLHDKQLLEDSMNIVKITAEAVGISNDGGKTYPYGITVNADAILRILQAEGVQAEWVKVKDETGEQTLDLQATLNGVWSEVSKIQENDSATNAATSEQITKAVQSSEQFIFSALESYVQTGDYELFKSTVSAQLQLLKNQLEVSFTESLEKTSEINDALQQQIDEITTYFRFTSEGQYIGRSDSEMQTRFANAIWEFLLNGVQQLYIDPDGVHGRQIHTDSIHIGDLVIQEQGDGSVVIS